MTTREEMNKQKKIVGENLRRLLAEKSRSQTSLAEEVGTTTGNMSVWVNGQKLPRPEMQLKLANALGVEVSELLQPTTTAKTKTTNTFMTTDFFDGSTFAFMQPQKMTPKKESNTFKDLLDMYYDLSYDEKKVFLSVVKLDLQKGEENENEKSKRIRDSEKTIGE